MLVVDFTLHAGSITYEYIESNCRNILPIRVRSVSHLHLGHCIVEFSMLTAAAMAIADKEEQR